MALEETVQAFFSPRERREIAKWKCWVEDGKLHPPEYCINLLETQLRPKFRYLLRICKRRKLLSAKGPGIKIRRRWKDEF
jgi:hypothetical protein